jgi:hypothetical protein
VTYQTEAGEKKSHQPQMRQLLGETSVLLLLLPPERLRASLILEQHEMQRLLMWVQCRRLRETFGGLASGQDRPKVVGGQVRFSVEEIFLHWERGSLRSLLPFSESSQLYAQHARDSFEASL